MCVNDIGAKMPEEPQTGPKSGKNVGQHYKKCCPECLRPKGTNAHNSNTIQNFFQRKSVHMGGQDNDLMPMTHKVYTNVIGGPSAAAADRWKFMNDNQDTHMNL